MYIALTLFSLILSIILLMSFRKIKIVAQQLYYNSKLPGPPNGSFLLGNCHIFKPPLDTMFLTRFYLYKDYFPVYRLRVAAFTTLNIVCPEHFEVIINSSKHSVKSVMYKTFEKWLREGLLTSFGAKWATRRKILTPAFHFGILRQFVDVFNEDTADMVESIRKQCHKPYIDVSAECSKFTLKAIAETAMGSKLTFKTKDEQDYRNAVHDMGPMFIYKLFRPWLLNDIYYFFTPTRLAEISYVKTLHDFTSKIITEKEKNFIPIDIPREDDEDEICYKSQRRLAMLDLLLNAEHKDGSIDYKGICEEVDTFMFEGHDTTGLALQYILLLLANHKSIQDQIVEELHEVLGDIHAKPTYHDLQNLKFMDRCIKESLRIYPSVPYISRQLTEDITLPSGYYIKKDTMVVLYIYDVHHNEKFFPDPEKFDPDRFLPENCEKRHPFAYLPFSAGPRNCIGQRFAILELKAALCGLLANFILEPIDTPETVPLVADFVLRSRDPIKVKFVPRQV